MTGSSLNVDKVQIRELLAQAQNYGDDVMAQIASEALADDRNAYVVAAAAIKGWYKLDVTDAAYDHGEVTDEQLKILRDKTTRYGHKLVEDIASGALSQEPGSYRAAFRLIAGSYEQPAAYARLLHGQG
jgi:hypothetical protein